MDLPQIPRFGSDGNLYVTGFFSDALKYYQGPNGAAPGTYIGNFTTFSGGSQPLGLTQVADTNELRELLQEILSPRDVQNSGAPALGAG